MAGSSFHASGLLIAILAIIAGILILLNWLSVQLIIGIFLIVWGILELVGKGRR
jgi:uncharacterized membrane protein HdeD (DUF308 family)